MDDKDRVQKLADLIVEMALLTSEEWLSMITNLYAPVPPEKRAAVIRIFKLMDADERLTACMLVALYKSGRLSEEMIDLGIKRGSRPFMMVLIIIS